VTGLEHGGYVPRGRKAEDGKVAERYNLVEFGASSYPARTRRNIEESDGTLIFSLELLLHGDSKLTRDYANKLESGSCTSIKPIPGKTNIQPGSLPSARDANAD
jgi:hypothetical protein